jgi:hypothetical protein
MTHCYTTNQIIKFLYNELPALEHLETEYAIENSPEWREKHNHLKKVFRVLPQVHFFPKRRAVKSILTYSATTA